MSIINRSCYTPAGGGAVWIAALLLTLIPGSLQAQSCSSCEPAQLSGAPGLDAGYVEVCIQTEGDVPGYSLSSDEADGMEWGITHFWGTSGYFAANDIPIDVEFTRGDSGHWCDSDVNVHMDAGLWDSGHMAETNASTLEIDINPEYTGDGDIWDSQAWNFLGAHEFGHILGFDDVNTPGCASYTIMVGGQSSLPSSMPCGDFYRAYSRYPPNPDYSDNEYEPSTREEDCWDWYDVTYTYCYSGGSWSLCDVEAEYLYTDCSPPY